MIFQTNTATDKTGKNKKTNQPYTLTSSAQHYANWVKDAKRRGMKVAFWEIGNEPENDAPAGVKGNDDRVYKWYNAKFDEQTKAMKNADPDAKIMGPASTNEWYWWKQRDLERFLVAHGNRRGSGLVDAISLHYYPTTGEAGKWESIRSVPQQWPARMDYVRQVIANNDTRDLPIYLTEWNFAARRQGSIFDAVQHRARQCRHGWYVPAHGCGGAHALLPAACRQELGRSRAKRTM